MHLVWWLFWGLAACAVPMEIWRQRDIDKNRRKHRREAITEIVKGNATEAAAAQSLRLFVDMKRTYQEQNLPWDQVEYERLRTEIWAKLVTDNILNTL